MAEPENRCVVNVWSLRVHDAPTIDAAVVGALVRGSEVELLEHSPDGVWASVAYGGRAGWVAEKYLNPLGAPAPAPPWMEEFRWMAIALGEYGVAEDPTEGSDARVLTYLASVQLSKELAGSDSTPWCSAFVNWCVEAAGYAGTNDARASSWLAWGAPVSTPRRGALTVLSRDGGHHVGFFVRQDAYGLWLLGGNQTNRVCIARYEARRLLGHRIPAA